MAPNDRPCHLIYITLYNIYIGGGGGGDGGGGGRRGRRRRRREEEEEEEETFTDDAPILHLITEKLKREYMDTRDFWAIRTGEKAAAVCSALTSGCGRQTVPRRTAPAWREVKATARVEENGQYHIISRMNI